MRFLYVVQRYGAEIAGGAELACRKFATHLAARGHDVEILTSRAISHYDWANAYPPGRAEVDGLPVHRLTVSGAKDERYAGPLGTRVLHGHKPVPLSLQRRWIEGVGPYLPDLVPTLERTAAGYDAVIFMTYLFHPTWSGLPVAARFVPTVLHPTAHDEPALHLTLFDPTFRHADAFAFFTPEEADLVRRRFGVVRPSAVTGIGVDLHEAPAEAVAAFRARPGFDPHGGAAAAGTSRSIGDRPYLAVLGRFEVSKGSEEISAFFTAYKARHPGPLALVVVGEVVEPLPPHPDIVFAGFVDEATRNAAVKGALALVQPSFFESFSMVLTEGWAQRVPALVQGRTEVLAAQVRRSGGGLPYTGYAEFEAALDLMLSDDGLRRRMGEAGRAYVERNYAWDTVMERYEGLLDRVVDQRRATG